MAKPLLTVRGLDAYYGGSHVIQNASLNVAEGESVALLGRNGAGKSTLMKSLLDAGPRVSGSVIFDGAELSGMPTERRSRLGLMLVPEDRRIYPKITVVENIELGRFAANKGANGLTLADIWALFPLLVPLKERTGFQLSGGQQQLVAVARGVFGEPKLLLLDEPVEGLAPVLVEEMAAHIRKLRQRGGLSLLIAEQNLAFARECTDRLLLIDSGRIVFDGSWEAFDADLSLKEKYLAV
jgi:ABC-type branched-subunit amino acid transport system ATPase component